MERDRSHGVISQNTSMLRNAANRAGVPVSPDAVAFLSGMLVDPDQGPVHNFPEHQAVAFFTAVREVRPGTAELGYEELVSLLWRLPYPFGSTKPK